MKKIKGDLIKLAQQGKFDVIVHGCNCFCHMGAGIAKQIKETFPEAFQADKATPAGERGKMGDYSSAKTNGLIVVNAYTQYGYGIRKTFVDYEAVEEVFEKIADDFSGKKIGYPKIGCGLGGGDWEKVSKIIDEKLKGEDHTLVIYEG